MIQRKAAYIVIIMLMLGLLAVSVGTSAAGQCVSIQSGGVVDSAGNPITVGYDQFGYNYQAHMFNGTYDGSDRVLDGKYWGADVDYADDHLIMKWSNDWLSNEDCNGDGKLDRGTSGISQGWLTNLTEGDYFDADGNVQHYTDFAKIVWVGPGGSLWGQYEMVLENYNDAGSGDSYHFHVGAPGFGLNDGWTTLP